MRSVSPPTTRGAGALRLPALAACLCLLAGGAAGCSTTQEKAAAKQAESARILKAQAREKAARKHKKAKHHDKSGRRAEKR